MNSLWKNSPIKASSCDDVKRVDVDSMSRFHQIASDRKLGEKSTEEENSQKTDTFRRILDEARENMFDDDNDHVLDDYGSDCDSEPGPELNDFNPIEEPSLEYLPVVPVPPIFPNSVEDLNATTFSELYSINEQSSFLLEASGFPELIVFEAFLEHFDSQLPALMDKAPTGSFPQLSSIPQSIANNLHCSLSSLENEVFTKVIDKSVIF